MAVEEVTGYYRVAVSRSKSTEYLLDTIKLIIGDYNISGHTVAQTHADAESVLVKRRSAAAL